jgi:septum formation protein
MTSSTGIISPLGSLSQQRVVLASGSPRRKELLSQIGLSFEVSYTNGLHGGSLPAAWMRNQLDPCMISPTIQVVVSSFEENLPKKTGQAAKYAQDTARCKAIDVASQFSFIGSAPAALVIAADTVVEHDGRILEKPEDAEHAKEMLRSLANSSHFVHTGVALVVPGKSDLALDGEPVSLHVRDFAESTKVTFWRLSEADIDAYVASGEPFGKAGSYGIQGLAAPFVKCIDGCYFNVVGLPLHRLCRELAEMVQQGYLRV